MSKFWNYRFFLPITLTILILSLAVIFSYSKDELAVLPVPVSENTNTQSSNEEDQANTPPDMSTDNTQSTPTPPQVAFAISMVYFSKAPQAPPGAGFGQCSIGQQINYTAKVDLSSTTNGTAQYHWEVADHLGGTINKLNNQSISFSNKSTKSVENTFTYTVRDTGNGTNLWNRQYINVFVTQPNDIYANKDNPVYAYKNSNEPFFVWGTYIDLC